MLLSRYTMTILLFSTALIACAAEGPKYTIKLKTEVDAGKTVTIEKTEKETGSTRILNADGKLLKEIPAKGEQYTCTQTLLSRGKNNSWKSISEYSSAKRGEAGKLEKLSYEGRKLVSERKDGVTRFGVVGQPPLKDADLQELLDKANKKDRLSEAEEEQIYLPTKAVAVGEEWKIDVKAAAKLLSDFKVDEQSSAGTGKLVKVYAKGKSQFGVLELHIKLGTQEVNGATFEQPFVLDTTLILDAAIDGSSTARSEDFTGTMKGKGTIPQGKEKLSLIVDLAIKGRKTRSEERDEPKALAVPDVKLIGPEGQWATYTSKEGKYSIDFPGKPEASTKTVANESVTTSASTTREKGRLYYSVSYTEYIKLADVDPQAVLESVQERLKEGVTESKDIKLGGHTGIHLVRKLQSNNIKMTMFIRAFYVDGRLYQVIVNCADEVKDKAQAEKFLDSFKLVAEKKSN